MLIVYPCPICTPCEAWNSDAPLPDHCSETAILRYSPGIRVASYTAAKSGLPGLTRLLANEWAAHRINVNAIAPGYMASANTAALRDDAQRNEEILGRIPAARWGSRDDLAGRVAFLAS